MPPANTDAMRKNQRAYWRRTRQLTVQLLSVWFVVTVGTIFFARELSSVTFFGWPVSFYMAAQGCGLIFLAIVAIYAWRMQKIEQRFQRENDHVQ